MLPSSSTSGASAGNPINTALNDGSPQPASEHVSVIAKAQCAAPDVQTEAMDLSGPAHGSSKAGADVTTPDALLAALQSNTDSTLNNNASSALQTHEKLPDPPDAERNCLPSEQTTTTMDSSTASPDLGTVQHGKLFWWLSGSGSSSDKSYNSSSNDSSSNDSCSSSDGNSSDSNSSDSSSSYSSHSH